MSLDEEKADETNFINTQSHLPDYRVFSYAPIQEDEFVNMHFGRLPPLVYEDYYDHSMFDYYDHGMFGYYHYPYYNNMGVNTEFNTWMDYSPSVPEEIKETQEEVVPPLPERKETKEKNIEIKIEGKKLKLHKDYYVFEHDVKLDEDRWKCPECERISNAFANLKDHFKLHTDGCFKCDKCDYKTTRRHILKRHYRQHTGEKPFVCDSCGAEFRFSHLLKNHRKIHLGIKEFECNKCHRKFRTADAVASHKKTHLPDEKRTKYMCSCCQKVYKSLSGITHHIKKLHKKELVDKKIKKLYMKV